MDSNDDRDSKLSRLEFASQEAVDFLRDGSESQSRLYQFDAHYLT